MEIELSSKKPIYIGIGVLLYLLLLFSGFYLFSANAEVTTIQSLGKCLKDKGVVMFGVDDCAFCIAQKSMFGDDFKNINYIDCVKNDCSDKNVKQFPSWLINNKVYSGLLSRDKLKELSGC